MDRLELARRLGAEPAAVGEARPGVTVVDEREPAQFMQALAAGAATGGEVFLADPDWTAARRAEMHEHVIRRPAEGPAPAGRGWLMIPSGGTSGRLKFARHDEETLNAAVRGFCAHFGLERVHAVGVLPLHHVSGLMAWMRCALTGGRYRAWSWQELETGVRPPRSESGDAVISLVPTQLQRLLAAPESVAWLRDFRIVFLGGGPAWPELLDAAARAELPLALSYGMTETAAMVTALRPSEFRAGARSSGRPLPHAHVTTGSDGVVTVAGESLFRGYYPERNDAREFITDDLGRIDQYGHLHVIGRRDAMIISGGKKVQPAEVEAALRASGEFADVAVIGVPDAEWGEAVIACYPAGGPGPNLGRATQALANHQRPKRFVAIPEWPRNVQGKVDRAALLAVVQGSGASRK